MNFMEQITEDQMLKLSAFITDKNRTLEEIKRAQGIVLFHEGYPEKNILALTGLKRSTIVKARKNFIKNGLEALKSKRINEITAEILQNVLLPYAGKKVLLFWDNAPWHGVEHMRKFLATRSNLLIINFPPYAPEENHQEHVWRAARANVTHNKFISNIKETSEQLLKYLNETEFKYKFLGFSACAFTE